MRRAAPRTTVGAAAVLAMMATASSASAQVGARPALPTRTEAQDACRHVAARGPAIVADLIADGALDANNDGRIDDVTIGTEAGTARGDAPQFRPRGGAGPVAATSDDAAWRDRRGYGARWLRHAGRTYTLHFETELLRNAVALGYIDPKNVEHFVCGFDSVVQEKLRPAVADSDELCARVQAGQVSYVVPEEANEPTPRRETGLVGRARIDFRNTGTAETLALLDYSSGSGRGCQFQYYDTVAADRVGVGGEARDVLMALQGIELRGQSLKEYPDPSAAKSEPYLLPPHCGEATQRWFAHRGKLFLDSAAARDDGLVARFRRIVLATGSRTAVQCTAAFAVTWRVRSMAVAFR